MAFTRKTGISKITLMLGGALFLFLCLNAVLLGISDDEAYYWVLGQRPALGYAFHPPLVAWVIAISQKIAGLFGGGASVFWLRLPACLMSGLIFWVASLEIRGRETRSGISSLWNLLAFASFFGISWMMVPDLPLYLGFVLLYLGASRKGYSLPLLFIGSAVVLLAKLSGVLMVGSAGLAVLLLSPNSRSRNQAVITITLGAILGFLPTLLWNSSHEWVAVLYQLRDRQSGDPSLKRWVGFWLIQLALIGPILFGVLFRVISKKHLSKNERLWNLIWILPPLLVFGLQPLKASFKLHWSLAFWFPVLLAWLRNPDLMGRSGSRAAWLHRGWAVLILVALVLPLHVGIPGVEPRKDVSTDFMGWAGLPQAIRELEEESQILHDLPIVGSRYQTAAQAAFAMKSLSKVTLLPRDFGQREDWPDLNLTERPGPEWTGLKRPVIFVADQRYSEGPKFPGAQCTELPPLETHRRNVVVKRIFLWSCLP